MFAGGDAKTRRIRALRRKLLRYLKTAPPSAFAGTDPARFDADGKIRPPARSEIVALASGLGTEEVQEWEDLCARFLDRVDERLPGVSVQLPPDEPRMAYAGDKSL